MSLCRMEGSVIWSSVDGTITQHSTKEHAEHRLGCWKRSDRKAMAVMLCAGSSGFFGRESRAVSQYGCCVVRCRSNCKIPDLLLSDRRK